LANENDFNRHVVAYGGELEDGTIADCHHVWLSDWQMENINKHWLLSLDYDLHKQLRKPIAKALLSLLQIGFYASAGTYTKRYDELCQFLGITKYKAQSRIKQQLDPSFKELQIQGFLADWDYDENKLHRTYNITWQAGDRFYKSRKLLKQREKHLTRPALKQTIKPTQKPKQTLTRSETNLIQKLTNLNVSKSVAENLVKIYNNEFIRDWLEAIHYTTANDKAAYLVNAIKGQWYLPEQYLNDKKQIAVTKAFKKEQLVKEKKQGKERQKQAGTHRTRCNTFTSH
jgi:hypothetical protein